MTIVEQVRARIERIGWSKTARRSGVERVKLYRNFSPSVGHANPRLDVLLAVAPVVGLELALIERQIR